MCGNNDLELVPNVDMTKSKVSHDSLKWDSANEKFDACYYVIKNDPLTFKNAKLFVRFTTIGSDLGVHINGGSSFKNASEVVVPSNSTAVREFDYSIDQSSSLILTMHSMKDGSSDTLYAFEFWTEGEDWSWYEWPVVLYRKHFDLQGSEDQRKLGIIIFACAALLGLYGLICCLTCCLKKSEKDKIHIEPPMPTDASQDETKKQAMAGADLEMESYEDNEIQLTNHDNHEQSDLEAKNEPQMTMDGPAGSQRIFMGEEPRAEKTEKGKRYSQLKQ